MAYTPTVYVNGNPPAINASNLNKMEQGIYDNDKANSELKSAFNNEGIKKSEGIISDAQTENLIVKDAIISGEYYDANGDVAKSGSNWRSPLISVDENTSYSASGCRICFYDEDKIFISDYAAWTAKTFTTPADTAFIGVTSNMAYTSVYLYLTDEKPYSWVKGERLITADKIRFFEDSVKKATLASHKLIPASNGKQLFDKNGTFTDIHTGEYVNYDSGIISHSSGKNWFALDVTAGENYVLSGYTGSLHVAFFSKLPIYPITYISGVLASSGVSFAVPNNATIMTISVGDDKKAGLMVEKGTTASEYKDYEIGVGSNYFLKKTISWDKLADDVNNYLIPFTPGKQLFDKNGTYTQITTGYYCGYDSGTVIENVAMEYFTLPVTNGENYVVTAPENTHIAFYNANTTPSADYYISGVLAANGVSFTVPNGAVMMAVSVRQTNASVFMIEKGTTATGYEDYTRGVGTDYYQDKSITIGKLSDSLVDSFKLKKVVTVGSTGCDYTNICKAIKENQNNTIFMLKAETFDVEEAYKNEYGNDFFTNYTRYSQHPSDPMYRGLNLGIGCEIHGQPNTILSFPYTGNNTEVDKYFSVLSLTDNNVVKGLRIDIAGHCRYSIHDDYSTITGATNIIEECIFTGDTSEYGRPYIGTGMGRASAYIYRNCGFMSASTRAIGLHNNIYASLGRVEIYGCYCADKIYIFHYGESTEKTPVFIHDCKANGIYLTWADQENFPNENMEMFAWNNVTDN